MTGIAFLISDANSKKASDNYPVKIKTMAAIESFQTPDQTVMLTTVVLQDIKDGLAGQKNSKTVVIRADTPNDEADHGLCRR